MVLHESRCRTVLVLLNSILRLPVRLALHLRPCTIHEAHDTDDQLRAEEQNGQSDLDQRLELRLVCTKLAVYRGIFYCGVYSCIFIHYHLGGLLHSCQELMPVILLMMQREQLQLQLALDYNKIGLQHIEVCKPHAEQAE